MPDIAMCNGKDCPIKKSCIRFTATPTEERQSYSDFDTRETRGGDGCFYYENNGERCGDCANCRDVAKMQASVLRTVNPPFSHADGGVVDLWNAELERLPCR
jgi:hypothetical protein